MEVLEITIENFNKEILLSDVPVLLDFWAPWCGPCIVFNPILEEVAKESQGFKVAKINADENQELAIQYKIRSMPTLFVFKDGEVVKKSIGVITKKKIIKLMQL